MGVLMSPDENKAYLRRLFHDVWNDGDLGMVEEAFAAVGGGEDSLNLGHARALQRLSDEVGAFRARFPDLRFTVEHQWAAGDTVVTAWTARGTDNGFPRGQFAFNKQAVVSGVDVSRFAGNVIES
jgi:predicted ester cyclase